ncbi:MAG: hypothetical protein HQL98_11840 [Magnetococcales bacterium]|nr:hypothetical protein [Magnetococcales bacterium]
MGRIRLLGCLVALLLAGCAASGVEGISSAGEAGPVPQQVVVPGRDYKLISECLFRRLVADGRQVDLLLFGCAGKAELVGAVESIRVQAGGDGSVVEGSQKNMALIMGHLDRCVGERPVRRNY